MIYVKLTKRIPSPELGIGGNLVQDSYSLGTQLIPFSMLAQTFGLSFDVSGVWVIESIHHKTVITKSLQLIRINGWLAFQIVEGFGIMVIGALVHEIGQFSEIFLIRAASTGEEVSHS